MQRRFSDFCDEIADRLSTVRVSEAAATESFDYAPYPRTDERLAQCIWFDSLFVHDELKTDSGQDLEIVQSGRWNNEEGPDFRGAKIRIGDQTRTGDVEIHLYSSGWRQHRHHLNAVYDNVILHAYLWRSDSPAAKPLNSRGEAIESFCMEPALFPDLESIRQTVHVEDYPYRTPSAIGRCQPVMCSQDEAWVAEMLEAGGRERIEGKMRRFADQAIGESLEQVFYQAMMTSLGHKANKTLFFLLSKRAPLAELLDYLRDVEKIAGDGEEKGDRTVSFLQSVLLHVAHLAPNAAADGSSSDRDAETRSYAERLDRLWAGFKDYYADRLIPPTRQWITGVRPVNFAHRRIGGVAHLIARVFVGGDFPGDFARRTEGFDAARPRRERRKWIVENLIAPFVVEESSDFWTWRYNFASRRAPRPMKLIGADRAASIAFNALLPILLLDARNRRDPNQEERVWRLSRSFPPLESNSMIRHMQTRLFGEHPRGRELLTTELRQQGLFHVFASCCNHDEHGCDNCRYLQRRV